MTIEFPRGGSANGGIVNVGEAHIPCVVLADTSTSMMDAMDDLNNALRNLGKEIKEDNEARGKVEICIIQFDDTARIVKPFGSMYEYQAPMLDCGGMTHMYEAVDVAIREIQTRIRQYRSQCVDALKPWVFLISDGAPTDNDNGSFGRLMDLQKNDNWNYIPVAVGPRADVDFLKRNNANGSALIAGLDNFSDAFKYLSNSLSKVSNSRPGETTIVNTGNNEGIQLSICN